MHSGRCNTLLTAVTLTAAFVAAPTSAQPQGVPALKMLGKDFAFPRKVEGLPAKLSDFIDLQINSFTTGDGVKLSYWETGAGKPLIFVPYAVGHPWRCLVHLLEAGPWRPLPGLQESSAIHAHLRSFLDR